MYKLYQHQIDTIEWLKTRPKAIVALQPGLGKTAIGLLDCKGKTLIVTPSSLKYNWKTEASIWTPQLSVNVVDNWRDGFDKEADINIINYDILSKIEKVVFDCVILDEAHQIKNPEAIRTKAALWYIKFASTVRALTATPIINRTIELYPMLKGMGITKLDYISFGKRYCKGWRPPWMNGGWDFSGSSNEDELRELLHPYMIRYKKEDVLKDLPEKNWKIVELDLPIDQREKELDLSFITEPEHKVPFEALSMILKMNAERKLPKAIQYIKDLLEHEEKVVIFAHHSAIVSELLNQLKKYHPVSVTGSTPAKQREVNVKAFQSDKKVRVFVGNLQAASVGLTLTAASNVCFVESSWSPSIMEQALDRCHRISQKSPVLGHVLTIHQSVDAQVLTLMLKKNIVINQIVNRKK